MSLINIDMKPTREIPDRVPPAAATLRVALMYGFAGLILVMIGVSYPGWPRIISFCLIPLVVLAFGYRDPIKNLFRYIFRD